MNSTIKSKVRLSDKCIDIWYTNIDTLTKEKILELEHDIKTNQKPDIIMLTEIKPKNFKKKLDKTEYKIEDFEFEVVNFDEKNSTRGVGMYIHKGIPYTKLDMTKSNIKEILSISITMEDQKRLIISNIYRSPNSSPEESNFINNHLKNLRTTYYEQHLILGDFNRKNIDWDSVSSASSDDNAFIEATRDGFLTQLISHPTRARGTDQPSLIDLLLTSNAECIESLALDAPYGKSDHSIIKFTYRCKPESQPDKIICKYEKADFEKMKNYLDIDWEQYLLDCGEDIDKMWDKFSHRYFAAEKEYVPRTIVKSGKKPFSYSLDRKTLAIRKRKYRLWKR